MKTDHAAQLATLVAAAGAFLAAALLTSEHQLFCKDQESEERQTHSSNAVTLGSRISPSVWIVSHGTSWDKNQTNNPINNQSKRRQTLRVFPPTLALEPHLHLMVEVREQGPQRPSWHICSHRWMESGTTRVLIIPISTESTNASLGDVSYRWNHRPGVCCTSSHRRG